MKLKSKIFTSFLFISILFSPLSSFAEEKESLNPEFLYHIQENSKNPIIPSPIQRTYYDDSSYKSSEILPEVFDLRDQNRVTSVKNQGSNGDCWSFASISSLESLLSLEKIYDFSENNLARNNGFDFKSGGNFDMASAYFARWDGPALEEDDKYSEGKTLGKRPVQKHVQEIHFIAPKDYNQLKKHIMNYGAVYADIYGVQQHETEYFNQLYSAQYYDQETKADHAISVIGWDDNFPKENFGDKKPQNNGAFLCKNSWGETFGENGYFYVSYEDKTFAKELGSIIEASQTDNFDYIYQYDPLGVTSSLSANWYCNVFTKKSPNENLSAIGLWLKGQGDSYDVYLVDNYKNSSDLKADNLIASGSKELPGYYTIHLNKNIKLPYNRFAIIVKITSKEKYPSPLEAPVDNYATPFASDDESYYSSSGIYWRDLNKEYPNTNFALKAFTKNAYNNDTVYRQKLEESITLANQKINTSISDIEALNAEFKEQINRASQIYNSTIDDVILQNAIKELESNISIYDQKINSFKEELTFKKWTPMTNQVTNKTFTISFSEPITLESINSSTIYIKDEKLNLVPCDVILLNDGLSASIKPKSDLISLKKYFLTIKNVKSRKDTTLNPNIQMIFTTI